MRRFQAILVVLALSFAGLGHAQEEAEPEQGQEEQPAKAEAPKLSEAEVKVARALLEKYLDLVKKKKWAEVKKLIHPKTLETIAKVKARLKEERHSMAPWYWEKTEFYLKEFKIETVGPAALGTVVAKVKEDNFQVQEKGMLEGEVAAYLLAKSGGKWYVIDKKQGEDSFSGDSIKFGYKGYFDGQK